MLDTLQKRLVRSVTLAVLLAAVIGFTLGVYAPAAHAAGTPGSVVGPREPISCHYVGIGQSGQKNLPNNWGYWSVTLYADYDTYTGAWCGHMYAETHIHENPGAPHGSLLATIWNCTFTSAQHVTPTSTNGGGLSGLDYWNTSPKVTWSCAEGEADFSYVPSIYTGVHYS